MNTMKLEPLHIEHQESQGRYLLKLSGELDLAVVPQLQAALDRVLKRTDVALVLDMKNITYIDSTGIGIIVSILKTRHSIQAPFYVRNIPERVRRLFDMTGLSGYLKEGEEAEA
ncbi:STAS domain-containing protein [Paenibacillus sp. J5C_2022]|nr:STAS domain-containing protein [Paenibacillus sp. J5C2022]